MQKGEKKKKGIREKQHGKSDAIDTRGVYISSHTDLLVIFFSYPYPTLRSGTSFHSSVHPNPPSY